MVCLEPKPGQDGGPGLVGTFLFHGKVRGRLGLSVPIRKMSGLDRSCVSHGGASGESRGQERALCLHLGKSTFC